MSGLYTYFASTFILSMEALEMSSGSSVNPHTVELAISLDYNKDGGVAFRESARAHLHKGRSYGNWSIELREEQNRPNPPLISLIRYTECDPDCKSIMKIQKME